MPRLALFLFLSVPMLFTFAQDAISLDLQPYDRYQATPTATLAGTLSPADSVLFLNGNAVTPDPSGAFSVVVPLIEGENTLLFRATHAALPARTFKHALVFDQTPPRLLVDQPGLPFYTNQT
ncbi:hypothetical protein, partial [Acanthopleuribacter pedis]